uniref:group II intron reverse transcriptase/maturase n=1 Tax=Ningiella ruwaisensis TaxID=2364274 RepID=UPI0010A00F57|nr:group II intron reverse transcriptase/maturase [Ningiella ruwaisensis]
MRVHYSLYGRLLSKSLLHEAYKQVARRKGAAGIDGQSLRDFAQDVEGNLNRLLLELQGKRYQAQPVRRVEIPKDDGGVRLLGIPCVRDRIVQQALMMLLQPIFEEDFHPSSYGYRPRRSCHDAINKATVFMRDYGRCWVVDMDLSKCFDTLNHDLIIQGVRKRITDGSVLALIRQFLQSGVMVGDGLEATLSGSPQGGVISPLLANIYLDAFDQEMERRGHRIVRYADDILILCTSKAGAENALNIAVHYLEKTLKLTVNTTKTHIVHSDDGVKFLGVEIGSRYTFIQTKKVKAFKQRVKQLTRRNTGKPLLEIIKQLNPVLRGFENYFKIANCKRVLKDLSAWIRRRLRAIQLTLYKKPSRLHRRLRQFGITGKLTFIKMNSWRNSNCPMATMAMRNSWFEEIGLYDLPSCFTR